MPLTFGTARGPGDVHHTLRLGGFDVEIAGADAVLATDAALKLGATLQQLADRAPVYVATDSPSAAQQFTDFCRAVVRFDLPLMGAAAAIASDAALKLGATYQQLVNRAPVFVPTDPADARQQFLAFCRAVVG